MNIGDHVLFLPVQLPATIDAVLDADVGLWRAKLDEPTDGIGYVAGTLEEFELIWRRG